MSFISATYINFTYPISLKLISFDIEKHSLSTLLITWLRTAHQISFKFLSDGISLKKIFFITPFSSIPMFGPPSLWNSCRQTWLEERWWGGGGSRVLHLWHPGLLRGAENLWSFCHWLILKIWTVQPQHPQGPRDIILPHKELWRGICPFINNTFI